ncbi:MAG: 30S ribosomal protein S1 [Bacteroidales bacterium]|nr:30S ribosomal protein S1 [Bacteroidales bacterium]
MTNETEQTQNNASESKAEEPVSSPEKTVFPADKIEDDFDWESLSEEQINYSEKSRKKYEKMYEDTLNIIVEKELINGTIVAKNNREVIVNIGYKSDGVIPISEFKDLPEIKIGDQIEVFIESQEDLTGQLILSHKKAKALKSWEKVNDALEQGTIINGYVKCRTKGGLIIEIFGIEAFLPGSQIDIKPIRDYDIYVGKTLELKVVKINNEYKNVVVSHKALIEAELEQQKAEIISRLEKGQVLEGTVKNITSYGVFIDLGGIDGLVHITDLTWGRITHPEEVVKLDEKLKVVILDFDENMKRIALGLKQLTPHPWDALDPELKVGDKTKGKVVVIADYGAFIEIVPGVEGLIHVSEMSWSQHLRSAQDFLKINDEVEAVILTLDREGRKMSLGMKQLIPDPWTNIVEKYPVNSKHKAKVRNFTAFGIFVELEEGVDGLIHISDLSWSKKIKHPAEFTKINEELDVIVLDIDSSNRRLSLGHKQLEENPWEVFETIFTLDSVHRGTITQIVDKGAIVNLEYGVEGFVPQRHLIKENKMSAIVDETLDFKVIEFSKENKKIILSHSKIHLDEQASKKSQQENTKREDDKGTKKALKKVKDNIEKSTLGDLGILGDLKTDLENKERAKAKQKKTKTEEKHVETKEPEAIAPETKEPEAIAPETKEPEAKIEPTAEEEKNKPENQE